MGWILAVALILVALVAFPSCTTTPTEQEEEEEEAITIPYRNADTFIEQSIGGPETLDPAWAYDTASSQQQRYIYETLLYYDGEAVDQFLPVLATEWTVSEDGTTFRFHIRSGVKFHNGDDLTPEDVEYSIERALVQDRSGGPVWMLYTPLLGVAGSRAGGAIAVTFDQIDNAIEVDGDWVQFNLAGPFPTSTFFQILCGNWAMIVDKDWCIANGEWDGTAETWEDFNNPESGTSYLWDQTNGTGPWMLEEWDPQIQVKVVRNDNYWQTPASFERIITMQVEEWTSRKLAFLAGDADLVYVPAAYISEMDGISEDIVVHEDLPSLTATAMFFNFDIGADSTFIGSGQLDGEGIPTDFFSDIDVRKGFAYAFDWDTYIKDGLSYQGKQVGSPVIDGIAYYNPDAPMYTKDLDKATEHLQAAWGGEVWDKGFKFTLLYNNGNIARKTACEILSQNLVLINPKFLVSIQPADWGTFIVPQLVTGLMPMFAIGWLADYPDPDNWVVPFMASWGAYAEFQAYRNTEVDDLIREGAVETDPAVRQDIYYQLQQIYYDDAPGFMLSQNIGRRYFTKYIHGWYYNPMETIYPGPLYDMSKSES